MTRNFFFLFALLWVGLAPPATAQGGPVVVELFTSQGCSSCPPADAMLHDLDAMEGVIALGLHVDYWDYIGWKDSFGRPENTARQHAYARAAAAQTVYTPQMVINGQDHVIGSRPMQVMAAIQEHAGRANPVRVTLTRKGAALLIVAEAVQAGDYTVQMVRYMPLQTVEITRGENAGRTQRYANVVTGWDVLTRWNGRRQLALEAPLSGDQPVVVIVQQANAGPIAGAAILR